MPAFTTSEEAFAAEELLNAFRSGDADQVTRLIKPNSVFMNIDNQVTLGLCLCDAAPRTR